MKRIIRRIGIAVLAVAMTVSAAPTTFSGILTDNMCTRKHMIPGQSDDACVRECVKGGAKYALVSDGKAYELKTDIKTLDKFAGEMVTVTGSKSGTTIIVTAIKKAAE